MLPPPSLTIEVPIPHASPHPTYRSFPAKPAPCDAERLATLACYQATPDDPLRCASQVDQYSDCAMKAFNVYVKKVNAAGAKA